MSYPRILIGAASSGSGKTMITCGILQALVNRGMKTASFKCGPDYIDPMFHAKVIGTRSKNLDTFFAGDDLTRYLFTKGAEGMDISVMEGVMGYYDGVAGTTPQAGAYDLARATDTPAVLIVNTRGMSLSVAALVKGFVEFVPDSRIKGVILNQMSEMLYPRVKEAVEKACNVKCYGYVPIIKDFTIESRHLGLVLPDEVKELNVKLNGLAEVLEKSLDLDGLIELAKSAPDPVFETPEIPHEEFAVKPRIGVAMDEAFCFYYKDNLELLQELGAELVEFSPIRDEKLPEGINGLLLGGGYPELCAKELSENKTMLADVKAAIEGGMPTLAECGGFMYLNRKIEDMNNTMYDMVGVIDGEVVRTPKLKRFGYISVESKKDGVCGPAGTTFKAHEFHYFESSCCGEDYHAKKPQSNRNWECTHVTETLQAGFPHMYYYSDIQATAEYVRRCAKFGGMSRQL